MLVHKNTVIIFTCATIFLLIVNYIYFVDFFWFLFLAFLFLTVEFYGAYFVQSGFHIKTFNSVETSEKVVAITFDDGPNQKTQKVLEVLDKYNVKATFFCIGKNIKGNESIIQQIQAKGHIIGNHSYSHSNFFDFNTTKQMVEDLTLANNAIKNITGDAPVYFRPPYGVTTPSLARACEQLNLKVIGWNIRSLDTVIKEKNKVVERVTKKIKPGSVILLHDSVEDSEKITEDIICYLNEHNYKILPLNKLFEIKNNA